MELSLKMGELDEEIIKHGMQLFGLSRDEVIRQLNDLVDRGFLLSGDDNFQLSSKGIKYVEKNILNKNNDNSDLR